MPTARMPLVFTSRDMHPSMCPDTVSLPLGNRKTVYTVIKVLSGDSPLFGRLAGRL